MLRKSNFLKFALAVLLVFSFAAIGAAQQPIMIKFGHFEGPGEIASTPYHAYTGVYKNIVEGLSGGRIKVQLFPSSQLGDIMSMAEQTAKGVIQISGGQNAAMMAAFSSNMNILEMPYSIKNTEVGRELIWGPFGKELSDDLAAKSGIRILSYVPNAFRHFTNSKKEIRSPADLKGMRIRVQEAPIHIEMLKALGASPTPMSFMELYSALQTGLVDGQENPVYVVIVNKMYEVQKFMTLDGHLLNIALIIMNDKFYKSLSKDDQWIIDYAAREAQFAMAGMIKAKEAYDIQAIQKAGVKLYYPTPAEVQQFIQATKEPVLKVLRQKVEEKWIDKYFKAIEAAEKKFGVK